MDLEAQYFQVLDGIPFLVVIIIFSIKHIIITINHLLDIFPWGHANGAIFIPEEITSEVEGDTSSTF